MPLLEAAASEPDDVRLWSAQRPSLLSTPIEAKEEAVTVPGLCTVFEVRVRCGLGMEGMASESMAIEGMVLEGMVIEGTVF